ncbi:MAG TPA: flagellar M-ring protein FliF C-terminal domain-containing protein [Pirellulales bacterium]|jgi:flagellar M-ring protein FliF|nr:flagellar M-ring protein FliF C-terminal domain-containing protein [Pirellulales bacterium]
MDFLTKAYAQLLDLFRSMTVGARIVAGMLLVVIVVSVAYLFNHTVTGGDEFLMNGEAFPAAQIPAMLAAFGKANLSNFTVDGNRIHVPRNQQSAYMGALADANALPKNFGDYIQSSVSDISGLTPMSRQKEMIKIALERELNLVISSMRGIEAASVLYDSETDSGLNQKQVVTATVSVKPVGNDALDPERVQTIRQVVAGAISGLSPKNVVVADLNSSKSWSGGGEGAPSSGTEDPYYENKRVYEEEWEEKIRGALAFIPGVNVKVNVDLNPELEMKETDETVDPKPVPIDVSETNATTNTLGPAQPGGRPGLAGQGGTNVGASVSQAAATGPKSEDEKTNRREKSVVSTKTLTNRRAPLTPRRVTVTVGVLSSYYEKIWQEQHPAPPGTELKKPDVNALATIETDEKKKIQEFVAQLIPLPPRTEGAPIEVTPLVTVMTFQHIPSTPIQPPSVAEKGLSWLGQYWSTLGTLGLGMVSLLVLRSMVRSVPATESPRSAPAASPAAIAQSQASEGQEATTAEVQEAAAKLKRRVKSGPSMRDELVEIVREDPDAAANILRSWIGSAT